MKLDDLKATGRYTFVGGPFGSSLTAKDYVEVPGVPVIRGSNLGGDDSRFLDDNFVFVSEAKSKELERNLAFPGDMVFTQRGTLGQVGVIPRSAQHPRYVVSQSQMKLTVDSQQASPRFLYHYFKSPNALAHLNTRVLATGVPHINLGILKDFPVPLPSLPAQVRIADILDRADAIRRKRQEAIRLTERFLRSVFLEAFGDPVTNPKGWPTTALGRIADFVGGGTPSRGNPDFFKGTICWATSKDMKGEHLWDTEEHITEEAVRRSATKLVNAGALLVVVKSKVLMHTLPVLHARVPTCFGQDLKAITSCSGLPTRYLARHMRVGASALLGLARGANTEGLTLEHLRGYLVMMPPRELLLAHEQIELSVERSLVRQAAVGREADRLFESLGQRAFRGDL